MAAVSLSVPFLMEPVRQQTSLLRIAKSNKNSSVLILPDRLVLDAQGAELGGGLPWWQDGCLACRSEGASVSRE